MALAAVNPVIIGITERKMRLGFDEFYTCALNLQECARKADVLGDPFTGEGIKLYTQYLANTDRLFNCYNDLANYFSLLTAYAHDSLV